MSQTDAEASTEPFNSWIHGPSGWGGDEDVQNHLVLRPAEVMTKDRSNIICGLKFIRSRAQEELEELQFIFGMMSMSLESIKEFNLTEPLADNHKNELTDQKEKPEIRRVQRAISSFGTNPELKAAIRAKLSVASAHVVLYERSKRGLLQSVDLSDWTKVYRVFDDYEFRDCRNFFSHGFLSDVFDNDLEYYKRIQTKYTECVSTLEVLIEKLQIGLADESAWKAEKSALSYSERAEYGMDNPEAETEAEEKRQIKAKEVAIKEVTIEPPPDSPVEQDPTIIWLADTRAPEWIPHYRIERRQTWGHPHIYNWRHW